MNILDFSTLRQIVKTAIANNDTVTLNQIQSEIHEYFDNQRYYEFFSLDKNTPQNEIDKSLKNAMKFLAGTFHPDRNNQSAWSNDIFAKINKMYDTLSDVEKRKEFDTDSISFHYKNYSVNEILKKTSENNQSKLQQKSDFDFSRYTHLFSQSETKNTVVNLDTHEKVQVNLIDYLFSNQFDIQVNQPDLIERCLSQNTNNHKNCKTCDGTGYIKHYKKSNFTLEATEQYAQNCLIALNGLGMTWGDQVGKAHLELNFVDESGLYSLTKQNEITYHVKITYQDLLNKVKHIQLPNNINIDLPLNNEQISIINEKCYETNQKIKGKKLIILIDDSSLMSDVVQSLA